jgi:hypothetical protein
VLLSEVPHRFQWIGGEAKQVHPDIPEGCQKVAGGRATRYLRFRYEKELHQAHLFIVVEEREADGLGQP